MPLFPRITSRMSDCLTVLLHLLLTRALIDSGHFTWDNLPSALRDFDCDLEYEGTAPVSVGWTCAALLQSMGPSLNCWQSSPLTLAVKDLITAAPSHSFVNLYIVAILRSAAFTRALATSPASRLKRAAMAKVRAVVLQYPDHPMNLVDSTTRAGRVLRGKLAPLPRAQARALLVAKFRVTPRKVLLKQGRSWLPKRTIVKSLCALPGFGPYAASVFWPYYRLATRYPASLDSSFAACGPGARTGLNWLRGYPPAFCKEAQGHQADLFFSDQLDSLGAHFLRNPLLKDNPSDSAPLRSVKRDLRRHLSTLEGRGYALCEFSKVVSHQLGVAR